MRHKASKIDFRRLAGEVEDSDSEVEMEQPSIAKKPIINTGSKYRLVKDKRDEDEELQHPRDACVCCHQVNQRRSAHALNTHRFQERAFLIFSHLPWTGDDKEAERLSEKWVPGTF